MIALDAALRRLTVCQLTHESRGNGGGLRPRVWLRLRAAAWGQLDPGWNLTIGRRSQFLLSAAFCCSSSVQQSGLRETVGDPLGILFPLEGQPAQMFAERVFRIDLHELAPNATGLVHLVEMTESGRERGP